MIGVGGLNSLNAFFESKSRFRDGLIGVKVVV